MEPDLYAALTREHEVFYVSCFAHMALAYIGIGREAEVEARKIINSHNQRFHGENALKNQSIEDHAFVVRGSFLDSQPWRQKLTLVSANQFRIPSQ